MFSSKVNDQKLELLRAIFRNLYLKEKCEYLDGECKMLAELILNSQISRAETEDFQVNLRKEVEELQQLHEQKVHELVKKNREIVNVSMVFEKTRMSKFSSLSANKSIDEDLGLKDEMIKCLQEELIHVRLQEAEKLAIIRDLRKEKSELEQDKQILMKCQPETISRLQEELFGAKLLQNEHLQEFERIKATLARIKSELDEHLKGKHDSGNIKSEILEQLEDEKVFLKSKIPQLAEEIHSLNRQILVKEQTRLKQEEEMNKMKIKERSIADITLERKRQCDRLEENVATQVSEIRSSSTNKRQDIGHLSDKLEEMVENSEVSVEKHEIVEAEVNVLEEKIQQLREKINQLNFEIKLLKK